jgi:hypothetical protein
MAYRQTTAPQQDAGALEYASWLPLLDRPPKVDQDVIDFFCPGGAPAQAGRTTVATGIGDRQFARLVDDVMTVMHVHRVDPATRGEVVAILSSRKGEARPA